MTRPSHLLPLPLLLILLVPTPGAGEPRTMPTAPGVDRQEARTDRASFSHADTVTRGMVPQDIYRVRGVGDARLAPDGERVAFVVTTVAEDRRTRESAIWMVPADGSSEPTPFTRGTSDRSPRWSPDGSRLAFLADRNGGTQLHLIPVDGGEARPLTGIEEASISDFRWFPDGERILLLLSLDPGRADPTDPDVREDGMPTESPDAAEPDTVRVRDAVYKADGVGYLDGRRRHLWILEVESGELRRLTRGSPDWNESNPRISPDGSRVVFNADRTGEEYDGGFDQDLWWVPVDGEDRDPQGIGTPPGRSEAPLFSPDGRWIVYRHTEDRYHQPQLHLIEAEGGAPRVLTDDVDLNPADVRWAPDGNALYFGADHQGSRPLFRLPLEGAEGDGRPEAGPLEIVLGEEANISAITVSADGSRGAFTLDHERMPPEIHVAELAPGTRRGEAGGREPRALQVTELNRGLLEDLDLRPLEEFRFTASDGLEVQGFLMRPVGWEEGIGHPLVLNIKGGPAGMWGRQWFHEFQMMAARGYAVVFVNYRGSTGYGDAHQQAVRLDYGGADFEDNMQALETALDRFEWIDPDRLFVTGGSHGGFLTNWITSHTDRFRAAVTQRSVSNWISEAGTQQYPPRQMRAEFGGTIWENFDYYWGRSPLARADRVRTPTLVIHSEEDHITPIGQGQEWYFALKAVGVPTEMVVFRGEGHGLSRTGAPVNLVTRLELILDWFDRWDQEERWTSEEGGAR